MRLIESRGTGRRIVEGVASHEHGPRPKPTAPVDPYRSFNRGAAGVLLGAPVAYGAVGYAGGLSQRKKLRAQNDVLRGGVAKKVYNIRTRVPLKERPGRVFDAVARGLSRGIGPLDSSNPRAAAVGAGGAAIGATAGALAGTGKAGKENRQLRRQLQREGTNPQQLLAKRVTPRQVTGLLARNRHNIAAPAAGVGVAGAVGAHEDHQRKGMSPQRAAAATAAGAGGAGAFYGTGVHLRAKAREMDNVNSPGQSGTQRKAARKAHLASFGLHPNQPDIRQRMEADPRITRTWPTELAGAKYRRALGQMSGTRGKLLNAAAIAVPSTAVLATGNRKGEKVHKAQRQYGYLETRRSAPRTAGVVAGSGLAAYGASHLDLSGPLAAGQRYADTRGFGAKARLAREAVEDVQSLTRAGTGHGAAWLGERIPGMGTALEPIPAKLRPAVALAGGLGLINASRPAKRRKFVPYGGL